MPPAQPTLAALVFCVLACSSFAQSTFTTQEFTCRGWQVDDGLPNNSVASLLQSRDGHLWLGTYDGFVRFDGRRFQSFRMAPELAYIADGISRLREDNSGRIWGLTDRGRVLIVEDAKVRVLGADPRLSGRSELMLEGLPGEFWIAHSEGHLARADAQGLAIERSDVHSLTVDGSRTAWALTHGGALLHRTNGAWLEFPDSEGFENRGCTAIGVDSLGNLWVARESTLWILSGDAPQQIAVGADYTGIDGIFPSIRGDMWIRRQTAFRLRDRQGWKSASVETGVRWVQAALSDSRGTLWIGEMGKGLTIIEPTGLITQYHGPEELVSDRISSLLEDREGSVWAGSFDGGLQQFRRRLFRSAGHSQGVSPTVPTSIAQDAAGAMWIAGHGGALTRLDSMGATHFPIEGLPVPAPVRVVFSDRDGQVWAGTFDQGLWFLKDGQMKKAFPTEGGLRSTRALFQDRSGRIWIGSDHGAFVLSAGKLARVELPGAQPRSKISGFAQAHDGTVWAASEGAGVYRIVGGIASRLPAEQQPPANTLSMIFVDDTDCLWMGVKGSGLYRWRNGVRSVIETHHGLPSDSPVGMCDDGIGYFWLTSPGGIIRVSKAQLHRCADGLDGAADFILFDKSDGMTTAQCSGGMQPSLCQANDGSIWVPTSRDVAHFSPSALNTNSAAPSLSVQLLLGSRPLPAPGRDALRFLSGSDPVEMRFLGLGLAAPSKIRYRHRLIGLDPNWSQNDSSTQVAYAHLEPGSYRFEVMATNEHGVRSAPHTAAVFEILPRFWQRTWVQAFALLALIAGTVAIAQRISARRLQRQLADSERLHALEHERARIARDLHDELGASLTKIMLLSQSGSQRPDPADKSARALREILLTVREVTRAMDEVVWAINPLHDSVESTVTYLHRYASRFSEAANIRCRFELPMTSDSRQLNAGVRHLLFMVFKEGLNNVAKHSGATEVNVLVSSLEQSLIVEIADNGKGVSNGDASPLGTGDPDRLEAGSGILGMTKRAAEFGGTCDVLPREPAGTIVRFTLPIDPPSRSSFVKSVNPPALSQIPD